MHDSTSEIRQLLLSSLQASPLPADPVFVQSFSRVLLFVTPWTAACQVSLSITNARSLLKLMSMKSVTPSDHLVLYCPLLLLPSIFPRIRVFSPRGNHYSRIGLLDSLGTYDIFSITRLWNYSPLISYRFTSPPSACSFFLWVWLFKIT